VCIQNTRIEQSIGSVIANSAHALMFRERAIPQRGAIAIWRAYNRNRALLLLDIRKRGAPSPDEWDAVALTFAEPVVSENWSKPLDYSKSFMVADTLESIARLRQQRERRIV
jgi:hypothetical protein